MFPAGGLALGRQSISPHGQIGFCLSGERSNLERHLERKDWLEGAPSFGYAWTGSLKEAIGQFAVAQAFEPPLKL